MTEDLTQQSTTKLKRKNFQAKLHKPFDGGGGGG